MRRYFPVMIFGLLFADLASLIWLGGFVGVLPVLALVVLGIFIGSALIRQSGTNVFTVLSTPNSDKRAISGGAAQGLLGAIAGLLFMIPGIVSDFIALALLTPWVRQHTAKYFEAHISADFSFHERGAVIDAEAVEIVVQPRLGPNSSRDH